VPQGAFAGADFAKVPLADRADARFSDSTASAPSGFTRAHNRRRLCCVSFGVGFERRSARQLVELSEKGGVNLWSRFTVSSCSRHVGVGRGPCSALSFDELSVGLSQSEMWELNETLDAATPDYSRLCSANPGGLN
jgi:hypothetical protein